MGLKNLLIDAQDGSFTIIHSSPGEAPTTKIFKSRDLGYGDNAPLITKELPGVLDEPNTLTGAINGISDGFVRGGAILAAERSITDTKRIGKFLLTGEGLSFLAKEAAIQRTNPQSLISPTNRVRLPLNLMAQIPLAATGVHVRRDGVLDTTMESNFNYDIDRGGGLKYEKEIKILKESNDIEGTSPHTLLGIYNHFETNRDSNIIKDYSGGANSVFGIGNTTIPRYNDEKVLRGNYGIFKKDVLEGLKRVKLRGRDKYKMGDPDKMLGLNDVYNYSSPTVDQINVADIFPRENLTGNDEAEGLKDLIKFKIALIDTQNPLNDEALLFRAHIESVNDSFTGAWNSYQYNGRAENFYTYNGFDRDIQFNFKVAPQSQIELKYLYKKLNYLVGSTAPEYVNRRMRGRYVRVTIGDWIYETPGFFTNIGLSWDSSFPWETNPNDDDSLSQHPQVLNVACSFKPIHDFAPESKIDKPFIIRSKTPKREWPNPPEVIIPIIEEVIPEEIIQPIEPKMNIDFKRVYAPGTISENTTEVNFGYVDKVPGHNPGDMNANFISDLLTGLAAGVNIQIPTTPTLDISTSGDNTGGPTANQQRIIDEARARRTNQDPNRPF